MKADSNPGVSARTGDALSPLARDDDSPVQANGTQRCLRIVLAEDHAFVRELIHELLSREPHYQVVAEASTAKEAISACQQFSPDILILDINLPGESGLEAIPKLKRLCPKTRILLCSGSVTEQGIVAALRTGADGFMEKTHSRSVFLEAVGRIAEGKHYFCTRSTKLLAEMARGLHPEAKEEASELTAREKEIVALIARGCTNKEIACKLHIAVGTVDTHRTNLMRKLGARNTAELTRYAIERRLV